MPMPPEITLTLFRRDLGIYAARLRFRSGQPGEDDLSVERAIRLEGLTSTN